jgi:CDP-glycerol glycerophosphotransferase (TagB/SpsB family)
VVPGEKDAARAVDAHGIEPDRIRAAGYIKLDYLSRRAAGRRKLFDDDRPVVLYNPHFDQRISSWPQAEEVIRLFAAHDRYNLIVAPHIRLSHDMKEAEKRRWRTKSGRHILVDLDSPNLIDMTYSRNADLYLGDMSSQLYEFLIDPRPAVFFNSHRIDWRSNPRHAGWHLGEVADHIAGIMPALDRAATKHLELAHRQRQAVREAFGEYEGASRRGAEIVAEAVLGRN